MQRISRVTPTLPALSSEQIATNLTSASNIPANNVGAGNLFIGDLPISFSESDIIQTFSIYGDILECKIMRSDVTGRSLSYGFMKFQHAAVAQQVIREMNGVTIGGRPIRINWGSFKSKSWENGQEGEILQKNKENNVSGQNVTSEIHVSFKSYEPNGLVNEEVLRALFSRYGTVIDVAIKKIKDVSEVDFVGHSGYGFVHFPTTEEGIASSLRAAKSLQDEDIDGVNYRCFISHKLRKYLTELNYDLSDIQTQQDPKLIAQEQKNKQAKSMIKQGRDGRIMQQNGGRMPGGPPSSLGYPSAYDQQYLPPDHRRTQHPSSTVHYGQIIAPQGYAQGYTDPREQYEREVYDRDQRDPRDPREQHVPSQMYHERERDLRAVSMTGQPQRHAIGNHQSSTTYYNMPPQQHVPANHGARPVQIDNVSKDTYLRQQQAQQRSQQGRACLPPHLVGMDRSMPPQQQRAVQRGPIGQNPRTGSVLPPSGYPPAFTTPQQQHYLDQQNSKALAAKYYKAEVPPPPQPQGYPPNPRAPQSVRTIAPPQGYARDLPSGHRPPHGYEGTSYEQPLGVHRPRTAADPYAYPQHYEMEDRLRPPMADPTDPSPNSFSLDTMPHSLLGKTTDEYGHGQHEPYSYYDSGAMTHRPPAAAHSLPIGHRVLPRSQSDIGLSSGGSLSLQGAPPPIPQGENRSLYASHQSYTSANIANMLVIPPEHVPETNERFPDYSSLTNHYRPLHHARSDSNLREEADAQGYQTHTLTTEITKSMSVPQVQIQQPPSMHFVSDQTLFEDVVVSVPTGVGHHLSSDFALGGSPMVQYRNIQPLYTTEINTAANSLESHASIGVGYPRFDPSTSIGAASTDHLDMLLHGISGLSIGTNDMWGTTDIVPPPQQSNNQSSNQETHTRRETLSQHSGTRSATDEFSALTDSADSDGFSEPDDGTGTMTSRSEKISPTIPSAPGLTLPSYPVKQATTGGAWKG